MQIVVMIDNRNFWLVQEYFRIDAFTVTEFMYPTLACSVSLEAGIEYYSYAEG